MLFLKSFDHFLKNWLAFKLSISLNSVPHCDLLFKGYVFSLSDTEVVRFVCKALWDPLRKMWPFIKGSYIFKLPSPFTFCHSKIWTGFNTAVHRYKICIRLKSAVCKHSPQTATDLQGSVNRYSIVILSVYLAHFILECANGLWSIQDPGNATAQCGGWQQPRW